MSWPDQRPLRILVIRYRFIGDTALAIPTLRNLRQAFPNAVIDVLAEPVSGDTLAHCPYKNELLYYGPRLKGERKRKAQFPTSLLGAASFLRAHRYDRCYILRRSFSSAILPLLAGIPHRVGFSTEGRNWLLQRSTPYADKHEVECFLDILRADGIPIASTHNENWSDPATDQRVDAELTDNGRTRVFVCAKSVFDLKDWVPDRFAAVITWLIRDRNSEVHFCDSPGNAGYYSSILDGVPAEFRPHCHDWSTKLGIRESGSLLRRMNLCFGIDTGFIHLAASFHVPVVGLYGPLEPWRWHPWDTKHTVLRPDDVSGPRPLLRLTVAEVQTALEHYLQQEVPNHDSRTDIISSCRSLLAGDSEVTASTWAEIACKQAPTGKPMTKPRVIHFVTGGGSGATKVALDLACGHLASGNYEPLLVLRRKKAFLPAPMLDQITKSGLVTAWVADWPKWTTRRQLAALIADFKPQIFAAHGFSEHIWGRQAAFAANVPVVLHIEQNCERYAFWRRWAARPLGPRTSATICVSHGVADHLRKLGLVGPRLEIIHNGATSDRYSVGAPAFAQRSQDIVMVARFARQKDQPTLIRAAKRLVDTGWTGRLLLGGDGKASHRRACEKLVRSLGLAGRVDFLGRVADAAPLYHRCRAAVLSTHYEGLPLVLIDYMSAGCAAIGSEASGVTDIIQPGINGWLFPAGDDAALADTLRRVLAGGPEIEAVVAHGRTDVPARFSLSRMITRYESLFAELLKSPQSLS